jgi:hypothetical protein
MEVNAVVTAPSFHAVYEVKRARHTSHCIVKCFQAGNIPGHGLHMREPFAAIQSLWLARQAADAVSHLEQARDQAAGDVSCGTGDKDDFLFQEISAISQIIEGNFYLTA